MRWCAFTIHTFECGEQSSVPERADRLTGTGRRRPDAHAALPDPRRRRRDPQRVVVPGVRARPPQGTDRHPDRWPRPVAGGGGRAGGAYALVRRKELIAIQIGGRGQWRVEVDELERFIQRKYAEARAGTVPAEEPSADAEGSSGEGSSGEVSSGEASGDRASSGGASRS